MCLICRFGSRRCSLVLARLEAGDSDLAAGYFPGLQSRNFFPQFDLQQHWHRRHHKDAADPWIRCLSG
jgi:hypothetical protein